MARRLSDLAETLGHTFRSPALLEEALSHSSAGTRDAEGRPVSYERLEFLGDRVLGLVIADMLLRRFPDEKEGQLARRHAALVRREALVDVATAIDLGAYIRLSRGEEGAGVREIPALLADVCEAVIAALFLDGGLPAAAQFIQRAWERQLDRTITPPQDAKTALQEWVQGRGMKLPTYETEGMEGPAHNPIFSVMVRVEGRPPVQGVGASKRAAEQAAAQALLDQLKAEK